MAIDILSAVIGAVAGGVLVAVAFWAAGQGRADTAEKTKLTTGWRLSELRSPRIVARDVMDVQVPDGAQVLASGIVSPEVFARCDVKQVPPVRAEFALDPERERAWLFPGGLRDGAWAVLTVDPAMVRRLTTEFQTLWDRASEYVERLQIGELAGRDGVVVETRGLVQEVLPYKDRFMIRLEDQGNIIGVLVEKDASGLRDERIQVKGRLDRDSTGYAVIAADDIRRIR